MTTATKVGGAVLKPCPFCGVVPVIERCADTHDNVYGQRKWWGVHCRSTLNHGGTCAVEIRPQASVEAAVARWNTRAPAQATIDELRAEVEALKAKQIDVEAVMRLADGYAEARVQVSPASSVRFTEPVRAAREALRASLLGGGEAARYSEYHNRY